MARPMEKLRDLGPQELAARDRDLTDQVFRLRFQMNTGQSEGLKKLRLARRDLARVKTLLREEELKHPARAGSRSVSISAKAIVPKVKRVKAKPDAKPKTDKVKKSASGTAKMSSKPRTSHGK